MTDTPAIHCAHLRLADIADLKPHPANPNKHPDAQIALLAKIIRHQGWRSPITVSKRSGFIVAGHGRLEAAKLLNLSTAPVDEQDFASEADELAHLIADNRLAEIAEMDRTLLRDLAEQLDTGDFDMDLTGFDNLALEELMTAAPPAPARLTEKSVLAPPAFSWVLVGIETVRFGEIASHVEAIAPLAKICQTSLSDEPPAN